MVLSAEPSPAPSGQTGRGSRAQGDEAGRTCQILRAIDGEDRPDGLLVSNKVMEQFKVFPHLGGSFGGMNGSNGAPNEKHSLVP